MSDIILKNKSGESQTYTGAESVEFLDSAGKTVLFTKSQEIPELTDPATSYDVLAGKQFYTDGTGIAFKGNIVTQTESAVSFDQADSALTVNIPAGYYQEMHIFHSVGNTGGNAMLFAAPITILVGSVMDGIAADSFRELLTGWHDLFQQLAGADMYYMPATFGLVVDGQSIPLEGAFSTQDVSAATVEYLGNSIDGSASMSLTLGLGDDNTVTIQSAGVTVGGTSVPLPDDGLSGVAIMAIPYNV